MRALLLSTYDKHGGAARAAFRLFSGLKSRCDIRLATKEKRSGDAGVSPLRGKKWSFAQKKIFQLVSLLHQPLNEVSTPPGFSLPAEDFFSMETSAILNAFNPDLVHLHWICNQFLSLEEISRIRQPVVWTMHDAWAMTGGCHVPGNCLAYQNACGNCPLLRAGCEDDLSRRFHQRKAEAYAGLDLSLVAPSQWLADCVKSSSLLGERQVTVIPNGLDVSLYRPVDKLAARQMLGLPPDKTVLLFGGMSCTRDSNKGFDLLSEALHRVEDPNWLQQVHLLIFGAGEEERPIGDLPCPVQHLGYLTDDISLVLAYSAADAMIVPSRQEAFGLTAAEALACGTPVVCFRTTGLIDIVDHRLNGYLAEPFDVDDLARGMVWVTRRDSEKQRELASQARLKAQQSFSLAVVAAKYLTLYDELLATSGRRDLIGQGRRSRSDV